MSDYKERKEERKELRTEESRVQREREEKELNEAKVLLDQERKSLSKIRWIHIAVVLAPVAFLLFGQSDTLTIYLVGVVWGILVRAHYVDTPTYKNNERLSKWYEPRRRKHDQESVFYK